MVLKACLNRPTMLVDKGPWYPQAFEYHGLPWRHETFGFRKRVERWFRTLKERTRRFYHSFQTRKGLMKAELFLRLYTPWYNWIRPHQTLGRPPA
ncbi:MAG: hypothetical protein QW057_00640 [Candidatus Bathyarchaeia archaeon]